MAVIRETPTKEVDVRKHNISFSVKTEPFIKMEGENEVSFGKLPASLGISGAHREKWYHGYQSTRVDEMLRHHQLVDCGCLISC